MANRTFAIVAAEFNRELIEGMIEAARQEMAAQGVELGSILRVPGCYEVPLVAARAIADDAVDALIVLGYIERGETLHGEVMGHVIHRALVDLQLKHGKPMGLGIIGPGATVEQAQARRDDYARAAVRAARRSCDLLAGS